jgi:hypothetical protein
MPSTTRPNRSTTDPRFSTLTLTKARSPWRSRKAAGVALARTWLSVATASLIAA